MLDPRFITQPRQRRTAPAPPKKRKIQHTVEEVTFDKDARAEYLTGFHKRKLARKKQAQEINEEKERLARIEMRKQVRQAGYPCLLWNLWLTFGDLDSRGTEADR